MPSVELAPAHRRDYRLVLAIVAPIALLLVACGQSSIRPTLETVSTCESGSCPPNEWVTKAAADFAGSGYELSVRKILVKWHTTGQLAWIPLYLVHKPDGGSALIDPTGKRYDASLDDFRRHNDLFTADDKIVAPRDLTAESDKIELVSVSGHTGRPWWHWLIAGLGLITVATAAWRLRAFLRRDPFDDPRPPPSTGGGEDRPALPA